jgi:hypothetical protein
MADNSSYLALQTVLTARGSSFGPRSTLVTRRRAARRVSRRATGIMSPSSPLQSSILCMQTGKAPVEGMLPRIGFWQTLTVSGSAVPGWTTTSELCGWERGETRGAPAKRSVECGQRR